MVASSSSASFNRCEVEEVFFVRLVSIAARDRIHEAGIAFAFRSNIICQANDRGRVETSTEVGQDG
jgi:hypothetical protein